MKWNKVSEHPLPEYNKDKRYIVEYIFEEYDENLQYDIATNLEFYKHMLRFCEFNPDEIESADGLDVHSVLKGKSEYKTATEASGMYVEAQRALFNQAKLTKALIDEPSWEEKFRWETARAFHIAEYTGTYGFESMHISIEHADEFINQLKWGRE